MNKFSWRYFVKVLGVFLFIFTFIFLAVIIYFNRLEPLYVDVVIRDFCYDIRGDKGGFLYWFFRIITEFGDLYLIFLVCIIAIVLMKCDYRSIILLLGILFSVLLSIGLKGIYDRPRPIESMRWMEEETTSFPSGHSTAVTFIYGYLIYIVYHTKIKRKLKVTLYVSFLLIIILVMFSRMILGVHYFTDVIAGASVGIMGACLAMQLYKICEKYDFITVGLFDKIKNKNKDK